MVIITAVILIIFVIAAEYMSLSVIWYAEDPGYRLLHWVDENIVSICSVLIMTVCFSGAFFFIKLPLNYLDSVIAASKQLAEPDDRKISLPQELKGVENEMNLLRQQALRNAFLAREAEQRKNDLIVYLAHDLKTPLTSVIGYLELLCDEPDISAEVRAKYTGIALDKAQRLEDLINEFFDITRFNLTTLVMETEHLNLSRMLEQITWEFKPVFSEKNLSWKLSIEPGVEIVCDPDKLERVLDNLIRNAAGYSYPGTEVSLTMRCDGDNVFIQVSNHGKTIPPEKLAKIFEQFYRIDSSRDSKTGGAGLGLAIAKEIVELHGGTICAESHDEQIRFSLTLPRDCHKRGTADSTKSVPEKSYRPVLDESKAPDSREA
ncbi:MAG: HAMP domain-containing histidine kinase [Clostridia bacterium]|nr:HAMP domain-containing histidine kinase [Clostridia bacterium]